MTKEETCEMILGYATLAQADVQRLFQLPRVSDERLELYSNINNLLHRIEELAEGGMKG